MYKIKSVVPIGDAGGIQSKVGGHGGHVLLVPVQYSDFAMECHPYPLNKGTVRQTQSLWLPVFEAFSSVSKADTFWFLSQHGEKHPKMNVRSSLP